jgi:hypothetical protein
MSIERRAIFIDLFDSFPVFPLSFFQRRLGRRASRRRVSQGGMDHLRSQRAGLSAKRIGD